MDRRTDGRTYRQTKPLIERLFATKTTTFFGAQPEMCLTMCLFYNTFKDTKIVYKIDAPHYIQLILRPSSRERDSVIEIPLVLDVLSSSATNVMVCLQNLKSLLPVRHRKWRKDAMPRNATPRLSLGTTHCLATHGQMDRAVYSCWFATKEEG